jgi:hypothetical protein
VLFGAKPIKTLRRKRAVSREVNEQENREHNTNEQEKAAVEEKTETEEIPQAPEPTAIGSDQVSILKHDIYRKEGDATETVSIELKVKNILNTTIGSALIEAELYDIRGNTLDTVEKKILDFKPGITRKLLIDYSNPKSDMVRSYCVRVARTAMLPEAEVTGNESIKILKHSYVYKLEDDGEIFGEYLHGVDIAIKNISETTISTVIFEAVFYDIEGNVIDTVKHSEKDLKPNASRATLIPCKQQHADDIKGYNIKIVKMTTSDIEKVQLRWHEARITDTGQEEVKGTVKNISNVKTDAALVATFLDPNRENIGVKVIILRDIEPNTIRQFNFLFKPTEGDIVRSYTLNIGDLVE